MKPSGIVTLLTDFGMEDPYAAMMKGVILSIHPGARLIDITHQIPPGAVTDAARILSDASAFFPNGTVHVAVVDPGVGTDRRAIAVIARSHLFVGPDNGILWPVIEADPGATIIHLRETRYFLPRISCTFHGRDVFAPAAGHLAKGVDPHEMGTVIHDPVRLQLDLPRREGGCLWGQVVRVDRFGNLITNIRREEMAAFLEGSRPVVNIGDLRIEGMAETYGQGEGGAVMALFDSSGRLEIAVRSGRAADLLGLDAGRLPGLPVKVRRIRMEGSYS